MVPPLTRRRGALRALLVCACLLSAHAANAQRVWTPPATLTPSGQQSPQPRTAMDGDGNVLVTWIREQGLSRQTQAARLTSSGSLFPIVNLYSPASSGSVPYETSDVALNASGLGAAVWVRATGLGPSNQIVQAAIFTGAAWRAAVDLMPAPASGVSSPRVAVDASGNVMTAWVQLLGGVRVVRVARFSAAADSWSAPGTISSNTESVDDGVALGIDDAGNAVAVWTGIAGGVHSLRAARYTDLSASWSTAASIAPAGRSPSIVRLAVNRAGTAAFVAYRGFDGAHDLVRAARLDPGSGVWGAPADVSTPGDAVVDVDVAVDEAGRAVAVWSHLDGTVRTARYAGAWTGATDLASGAPATDVSVGVDAVGNAVAAWARWDGARYRVQASAYAAMSGMWMTAEDVSDATGDAVTPRVLLHEDGTAVLVWQFDSDTSYIQASRYVPDTLPLLDPAVVSGRNIALTWAPGAGTPPTGYTIVASRTPGGTPFIQFSAGTATSANVTAMDGGYYVRVLATVGGVAVASNEILVIVGAGPAPAAPQNLDRTINGNVVTLTWTPPANEAIAPVRTYYVAAGSSEGVSNLAFFPTGSTQTMYVTGAIPNGSYWVRVYAEGPGGISPPSAEIRIVVGPSPPDAPVLSGGATGPGSVLLQWTAAPTPGVPVTGYQLRAGYSPGQSNAAVINLPVSPLSYGASGVPPGTYYVRVVPLSSAGPGAASNEIVVTVPASLGAAAAR